MGKKKNGRQTRRRAPQPVELGEGGVKFVRQGEYTVALECQNTLGSSDNSTMSGVNATLKFLTGELFKVSSMVRTHGGKISGAELQKQFRSSPLADAADPQDWEIWAETFSPEYAQRGRPRGAALTFLNTAS